MGAHPLDYARIFPPDSFIHVDWFPSAKALALYLQAVAADDLRYNKYFAWRDRWKLTGNGLLCPLCFFAHWMRLEGIHTHYENIEKWWRNYNRPNETENICIGKGRWTPPVHQSFLP